MLTKLIYPCSLLDCWIWKILTFAMMCENVFKLKAKKKKKTFLQNHDVTGGILGSFSSDVKEGWYALAQVYHWDIMSIRRLVFLPFSCCSFLFAHCSLLLALYFWIFTYLLVSHCFLFFVFSFALYSLLVIFFTSQLSHL